MTRLRSALHVLFSAAAVAAFLAGCHYLGVAHASTSAPDPVATATTATDATWDVVAHQGPLLGGLLLAYAALSTFLRANESKHWIAQGRTLSVITAGFMVAGAVIDWQFRGASVSGIVTALFAAIPLVMHSTTVKPATSASSTSSSAAAIVMLAILFGGATALAPACAATTKQRIANGFTAALDCEAPGLAGTFASMIPLAGAAVASWITADGKHIDKAQLRAAAAPLTDKDTQLRCALATALAIATTPVKAGPNAPAAAGLEVDTAIVRGEARSVLGELGWGQVRTSAGVL